MSTCRISRFRNWPPGGSKPILDPRSIKPGLLDELRRSAGERPSQPEPATAQPPLFDEVLLYDSPNGLLRFLRKLFNPILRLLFNPTPIAHAMAVQGRLHAEAAARAADQERRQAEWNALHYEILQRLVREIARGSLEAESLAHRVESLGAKVDFNDRRVRGLEGTQVRVPRQTDAPTPVVATPGPTPSATPGRTSMPEEPGTPPAEGQSTPGSDGTRRRRRRRRGRRGTGIAAGPPMEGAPIASSTAPGETDADEGFDQERWRRSGVRGAARGALACSGGRANHARARTSAGGSASWGADARLA